VFELFAWLHKDAGPTTINSCWDYVCGVPFSIPFVFSFHLIFPPFCRSMFLSLIVCPFSLLVSLPFVFPLLFPSLVPSLPFSFLFCLNHVCQTLLKNKWKTVVSRSGISRSRTKAFVDFPTPLSSVPQRLYDLLSRELSRLWMESNPSLEAIAMAR
jgi:hypothetical protein